MDDILIKPTWEEIPEEHKDKLLIQIDPGTAFGTGQHETVSYTHLDVYKRQPDRHQGPLKGQGRSVSEKQGSPRRPLCHTGCTGAGAYE